MCIHIYISCHYNNNICIILYCTVIMKRQWQTKTNNAVKMVMNEYAMVECIVANIVNL